MIRLSTSLMYQQSLNSMLGTQSTVSATQGQVSSGKRISVPSDDPSGASRVVALDHAIARAGQYSDNIDAATARLSVESNTLDAFNTQLDQARSLALQSIDGTLSASDRHALATQLVQIRSQLVSLANTADANGNPLFAGTANTRQPFVLAADGTVSYAGNGAAQETVIGDGLRLANSDPGDGLFMRLPAGNGQFVVAAGPGNTGTLLVGASAVVDAAAWQAANAAGAADYSINFNGSGQWTATDAQGNALLDANGNPIGGTYTDGGSITFNGLTIQLSGTPSAGDTLEIKAGQQQDVFSAISNIIGALNNDGLSDTARTNLLNRQIESIDSAQGHLQSVQADVGSRLSRIADQKNAYADLTLTLKSTLSDVQDTDMASAISQLMLQSTALQAAQQTFAKVQGMSLFDYLK